MELRHLRYFCAVAENQGFSRTARALHISQSAISEQIADLEREVAVPLLLRGHDKVRLAPHGEVFFAEAKKVLAGAAYAAEMAYLDPIVAVLPKGHKLARGPVDLRALAGERFVLVARETSSSLFDKIISLCSDAGFSPEIVASGSVWSSVMLLVQAGEGTALLPSNLQQLGSSDLAYCPLTASGASIELVTAWPAEGEGAIQRAFLDLVRDARERMNASRGATRHVTKQ